MKERALKYSLIAVFALLVIVSALFAFNSRKLNRQMDTLRRELSEQQAKQIIAVDSVTQVLTEQMIRALHVRDSLELERFHRLQDKQIQLIKEYEKINSDYSSIIIDRPVF